MGSGESWLLLSGRLPKAMRALAMIAHPCDLSMCRRKIGACRRRCQAARRIVHAENVDSFTINALPENADVVRQLHVPYPHIHVLCPLACR